MLAGLKWMIFNYCTKLVCTGLLNTTLHGDAEILKHGISKEHSGNEEKIILIVNTVMCAKLRHKSDCRATPCQVLQLNMGVS